MNPLTPAKHTRIARNGRYYHAKRVNFFSEWPFELKLNSGQATRQSTKRNPRKMAPSCSHATLTASPVAMAVWNHGRSDGQHGAPWEPKKFFSWLFLLQSHHWYTGSLSWAHGLTSSRNRFQIQASWAVTSARFWNCHDHGFGWYCALCEQQFLWGMVPK